MLLQDAAIVRAVVQQTRLVSHLHFDAGIKVTCGCTLLSNLSIFFAYHFTCKAVDSVVPRRPLAVGWRLASQPLAVGWRLASQPLAAD